MVENPMDVLRLCPVRKSRTQKQSFRDAVIPYFTSRGYAVTVEKGKLGAKNIVIGNPETARYLVTAHYDTPAALPFPNLITPCSLLPYIGYQALLTLLIFAVALVPGILLAFAGVSAEKAGLTWGISLYVILALMLFGPANKNNANDNTSGVVTLMEIARSMPEAYRKDVCFVLFDLEEAGLIGSSSYRKAHKKQTNHQIVLNMDCVGDGDELLIFPTKAMKKDAAKMAEQAAEIAGGHGADLVDINFGCPVNKIARRGAGSGMMREPDKMVEITRQVVEAVKLPVTVKTRLGWDEDSKIIVELAERLQDVGIQALTIHGRTRCQMYTGEADWSLIGKVKENPRMHIPIIGNGDINSPQKAKDYFDRYGVDAIMIGRATYGHPWIFKEIKHYLQTGELLPQMSVIDRVSLAKRHLAKSLEIKGDRVGVLEMRRHLSCYFKGLPDFKETRLKLVTLNDPQEIFETLDYIAARWGDDQAPVAGNVYNV